jgi:hypothetical protein
MMLMKPMTLKRLEERRCKRVSFIGAMATAVEP